MIQARDELAKWARGFNKKFYSKGSAGSSSVSADEADRKKRLEDLLMRKISRIGPM